MRNIRCGRHSFFEQLGILTNKPPRAKKKIDGKKREEEPGRGPIDTSSYAKERAGYSPQAHDALHTIVTNSVDRRISAFIVHEPRRIEAVTGLFHCGWTCAKLSASPDSFMERTQLVLPRPGPLQQAWSLLRRATVAARLS